MKGRREVSALLLERGKDKIEEKGCLNKGKR